MQDTTRLRLLPKRLLELGMSGEVLLFISATLVNAGNYLFNLVLGRWLGPAAFAELSFSVTLMLMLTLATATIQTVVARFAAVAAAEGKQVALGALRRWSLGLAWIGGTGCGLLLSLAAPLLMEVFQLQSLAPILLLAAGMPLYFALGVERGILQGATRFVALAATYQAEMLVRLVGALVLVAMGLGVGGAVGAVTLSFGAAYLAGWWVLRRTPSAALPAVAERRLIITYAGPVALVLAGQILINNSDVLLVKSFFSAEEAGQYAALALIGRIVFFATWSVVTAIFPQVAQRHQRGQEHRDLLSRGLVLVGAASALIVGVSALAPGLVVGLLFGAAYAGIAPLLWLYATATALYALANVVVSYRLALGQTAGSLLTLIGAAVQITAILLFHDTLAQVVLAQVGAMALLFFATLLWDRRVVCSESARAASSGVH